MLIDAMYRLRIDLLFVPIILYNVKDYVIIFTKSSLCLGLYILISYTSTLCMYMYLTSLANYFDDITVCQCRLNLMSVLSSGLREGWC